MGLQKKLIVFKYSNQTIKNSDREDFYFLEDGIDISFPLSPTKFN